MASFHSRRKGKPLSREILNATQLAALGAIVAESAYLEHLIEMSISYLSKLDAKHLEVLVPKSMMLGSKINILGKLADNKLRSKKRKAEFEALINDMKNNNTERRNAVHGTWWHTVEANVIGQPEAKHSSGGKISAEAMLKLADKISVTYWGLLDVLILNWLEPQHRKKRQRELAKLRKLPAVQ